MLWMRIPTKRQRLRESEEELRALLKQIQEFRNPPTTHGFSASLFETLQSTTLERVFGDTSTSLGLTAVVRWQS
jgi:hypothetical protein